MKKDPPKAVRYRECLKSQDFEKREAETGGDAIKASKSLSRQVGGGGEGGIGQQQMARPYVPAGLGLQKSQALPNASAVTERGRS